MLLEIADLDAGYGRLSVLRGVSLSLADGAFLAVLGPNGAGKSTLLRAIGGGCDVQAGSIRLDGREIARLEPHARARLGIATVPEGRGIWPRLTIRENLLLGAWSFPWRVRSRVARENLQDVLAIFPRLTERIGHRAGVLSGGEAQMLAIGRALMSRPRLLLVDEPSIGLAPLAIATVMQTLGRLRERRDCAILLVEQRTADALALADEACILSQGRIRAQSPAAVLARDAALHEAYFGLQRTMDAPGT